MRELGPSGQGASAAAQAASVSGSTCPWGSASCPTARGRPLVDVFVYHNKHTEGFRSLKEGDAGKFTFKNSTKGLESIPATDPGRQGVLYWE